MRDAPTSVAPAYSNGTATRALAGATARHSVARALAAAKAAEVWPDGMEV